MPLQTNTLYYGDNLRIVRDYIPDESVDLVYLDPPLNSNRSYNVLFKEASTKHESAAQIEAFEDTWSWAQEAPRRARKPSPKRRVSATARNPRSTCSAAAGTELKLRPYVSSPSGAALLFALCCLLCAQRPYAARRTRA
jgi:hypothetical protein